MLFASNFYLKQTTYNWHVHLIYAPEIARSLPLQPVEERIIRGCAMFSLPRSVAADSGEWR